MDTGEVVQPCSLCQNRGPDAKAQRSPAPALAVVCTEVDRGILLSDRVYSIG